MKIYDVHLPNQTRCLLIDEFLPQTYLEALHKICDDFSKESVQWQHPEWTQYRYIYQGGSPEWKEIAEYLEKPNQELAAGLGYSIVCDEVLLWAEFQGLGSLQPHVEVPAGKHLSQLYISKSRVANNGTTIYTEDKEILFQLPFRDNFSWLFDDSGRVMHGRENDVAADITRFTMMMHWRTL